MLPSNISPSETHVRHMDSASMDIEAPKNVLFTPERKTSKGLPSLVLDDLQPVRGAAVQGPLYAPSGYGKSALAE